MYLVLSALTSSPVSLVAATKASAFSFKVSFLEIYEKLMNFFIVLPFFFKYLANAEYMINRRPVASKTTLMIPDNFLRIWS